MNGLYRFFLFSMLFFMGYHFAFIRCLLNALFAFHFPLIPFSEDIGFLDEYEGILPIQAMVLMISYENVGSG